MFRDAFGPTAIQTALYYLPISLFAFVVENPVGYISPHVGVHALLIIGSVICLGACIGTLFYSYELGSWKLIFPMYILYAASLPLLYVGGLNAMIAAAPPSEAGTLGAIYKTSCQFGASIGAAIMAAVINGVNKNRAINVNGLPEFHAALYTNIALMSLCVVIGILFVRNLPSNTANSDTSADTLQNIKKGEAAEGLDTSTNQVRIFDRKSVVKY